MALKDPGQLDLFKKTRRRGKYGNVRCKLDGHKFDSLAECGRYVQLRNMQRRNLIFDLDCQVSLPFQCGRKYVADFMYTRWEGGVQRICEDVKGVCTAVFQLKRALLRQEYGLEVQLIKPTPELIALARAAGAREPKHG